MEIIVDCDSCAYDGAGRGICGVCTNASEHQLKICDICVHFSGTCNNNYGSCYKASKFELKGEKEAEAEDKVNHPKHYNFGKYETIDVIEDTLTYEEFRGYLSGTAIKYLSRARHKGNEFQDMEKARWYLDKWIEVTKRGKK